MDQVETSGKTVDDALKQALQKLGAHREQVEFTVLDEGKKGFLGRGGRDAIVRVVRLDQAEPPADDNRPPDTRIPRGSEAGAPGRQQRGRRPDGGGGQRDGDRGLRDRGAPAPRGDRPQGDRGGRGNRGGGSFEAPTPKLTEQDFMRAPTFDSAGASPEGSPAGGGRDRGPAQASRPPRADRPDRQDRPERSDRPDRERRRPREDEPVIEPDINAEEVDFAAHVTDDLLRILDINAELTIREPITAGDGKGAALAVIDISGDDLGLLIGRRGDTLLSMQYLVNLIVTRRFPGRPGVTIDVEHYRHRREEQVVSLATRMADRVRQTGNAITLEPMTAAERRLVHLLFAEDAELETNSIGEGDTRKVVISMRR